MMLSPAEFHEIVTSRRRGFAAGCWRAAFRVASWPYGLVMRWRNRAYDRDPAKTVRLDVPVIAIGNLTLGGTGKTPCVEWICRYLRERHVRVAIVSRGYGAEQGGYNDEARELEQKLPDVPHVQNPDRVAAGQMAIEEFLTQCIVLDDAFQHRRVARDLNLMLVDATEPYGLGYVFPRGTLREPLSGATRADGILLTRADRISPIERDAIRATYRKLAPDAFWCETEHAPTALRDSAGNEQGIDQLRGQRVVAFCGIGNPMAFRRTLEAAGATVVDFREFPDHRDYTREDVDALRAWVASLDIDRVVCTHKDLVKVALPELASKPLSAVRVGLKFLAGENKLAARLDDLIARIPHDDAESFEDASESAESLD